MPSRLPRTPSRTHRSPRERDARSKAVKCLAEQALLRGSLVPMQRTCGKKAAGARRARSIRHCVWRSAGAISGR